MYYVYYSIFIYIFLVECSPNAMKIERNVHQFGNRFLPFFLFCFVFCIILCSAVNGIGPEKYHWHSAKSGT
jgi:hypothetical protein